MDQVMLVAPETVDGEVKQYRIHPWLNLFLGILLCVAIGSLIGYFYFQTSEKARMKKEFEVQTENWDKSKDELIRENKELQQEIDSLNEKVQILSETVNQKTMNEEQLTAILEKQSVPTGFPLSKSASMDMVTVGDPMCIFTASAGAMVVSTATGEVIAVNDDPEYVHNIWIDHGNGYITIYRNSGEVKVKQGEKVNAGNALFLISGDNGKLGYQMMQDGSYIDPMTVLEISG